MGKSGLYVAALSLALSFQPADAHHSYVEFDQQSTIEIEGTLVVALWQNPHSRFTVAATDGTRWDIESSSVNGLRRLGAPLDLYAVGTKVKVAGWPAVEPGAPTMLFPTRIVGGGGGGR